MIDLKNDSEVTVDSRERIPHVAAPSRVADPRPRQILLAWLLLFAAFLLLRSHTFTGRLHHDTGLFLYGGQAAGQGMLPYRDFWDHKPPGVFYLHAPVARLFPFSIPASRLFDALWNSISATLFFLTLRWLVRIRSAVIATVFYVLFLSMPEAIRGGGLTEEAGLVFQGLFYLLVLTHPEATRRHAWLAGVCLGFAVQVRQTFALNFPILIVWLWFLHREQDRPVSWWLKGCVMAGLGMLVGEAVVSSWFALNGAWFDYIEGSYLFNVLYVQRGDAGRQWSELLHSWRNFTLNTGPYLAAPLLAGTLLRWMNPKHRWLMLVIVIGYVGDLAATMMSGEFYSHYYVQAAWPMCIALGLIAHVGIWAVKYWWREKDRKYRCVALVTSLVMGVVILLTVQGVRSSTQDLQRQYEDTADDEGVWAQQKAIGDAVALLTDPHESIQLLGKSPNSCYMLAGRYAASRYYHNTPIFKSKFQGDVGQRQRELFMRDLEADPPAVYILGKGDTNRPWRRLELIDEHIPQLKPILESDYVPLEEVCELPDDWWWHGVHGNCRFLILREGAERRATRIPGARLLKERPT